MISEKHFVIFDARIIDCQLNKVVFGVQREMIADVIYVIYVNKKMNFVTFLNVLFFSNERKTLQSKDVIARPNVVKFRELLCSDDRNTIFKLAKFCKIICYKLDLPSYIPNNLIYLSICLVSHVLIPSTFSHVFLYMFYSLLYIHIIPQLGSLRNKKLQAIQCMKMNEYVKKRENLQIQRFAQSLQQR